MAAAAAAAAAAAMDPAKFLAQAGANPLLNAAHQQFLRGLPQAPMPAHLLNPLLNPLLYPYQMAAMAGESSLHLSSLGGISDCFLLSFVDDDVRSSVSSDYMGLHSGNMSKGPSSSASAAELQRQTAELQRQTEALQRQYLLDMIPHNALPQSLRGSWKP